MTVQMVRFRTSAEHADSVGEQITALFAAVRTAAPEGMRYLALRESDEPAFTLILELPDGAENPLPAIPAAAAFREWLAHHTSDDPRPRACTVLGWYSV